MPEASNLVAFDALEDDPKVGGTGLAFGIGCAGPLLREGDCTSGCNGKLDALPVCATRGCANAILETMGGEPSAPGLGFRYTGFF